MTRRLFIFGLGFSGLEIAELARADGWTVAGTCTTEDKARRLREAGIAAHSIRLQPVQEALGLRGAQPTKTAAARKGGRFVIWSRYVDG